MKVRISGWGQLNGPVSIDKIIDIDEQIAYKLINKNEKMLEDIMHVNYPGVEYRPGQIICQTVYEEKKKQPRTTKPAKKQAKKSTISKESNGARNFTDEIKPLLSLPINGSAEEIKSSLDDIYIGLNGYSWVLLPMNSENEKRNSSVMTQIFHRYKIGLRNLRLKSISDEELKIYRQQFKKMRLKKFFNQFWAWLIPLCLILIMIIVAAIQGKL